ncbi:MAG: alpha/beta hydrolase [Alphaproteobacteria bacterium]|nr:alpha/beta hydrolase [Alphaproteobacteria bacterium]MBO4642974.1 alpha/beta hydrolase [Alphaproteobacteria bacterium]
MVFQILFGLVVLYLLITATIYVFQRRLMYNPQGHVNTPHRDKTPDLEKILLKTNDGLELVSYYKEPRKTKEGEPYPTVLYLHGNTGPAPDAAHKLIPIVDAGYGVLLLEYRGYGGNPGKPSEKGLISDAEAALHFIHMKQGKDAKVFYYGMSLGTGVANGLAERRAPAGLIQECGFTSMTDAAKVHYPMFPVQYIVKDTFDSQRRIAHLNAPVLVLHGEKDRTVPVEQGKKMFETAGSADKTLKLYPEGGHTNLYDFGASDDVVKWLTAVRKR